MRLRPVMALAGVLGVIGGAVGSPAAGATPAVPRFTHVVVVVMENHSGAAIVNNPDAPYINSLMTSGAKFTNSNGVTHPSQPNYLALFSGSTQGVTDDSCPHTFGGPNLGSQLRSAGLTFAGYSESMPAKGYTGCASGEYVRKHNPWVDFSNTPAAVNHTMLGFPSAPSSLPTVAFVIPNLQDDMHDGTVAQADNWLRSTLSGYVTWANTHQSALILTWDEDDYSHANNIPTVIVGAHVRPGSYTEFTNHYRMLRTLQTAYGLPALGSTADYAPITDTWK